MTPRALDLAGFPLLASVVEKLTGEGSHNACFHRATALALDLPGAELCIGTIRGATAEEAREIAGASPVAFVHAWIELGGEVIAPTTIERAGGLYAFPRAIYYAHNAARDVHRLTRRRVKRLATEHGWRRYLRTGKRPPGSEPLGAIVLAAAGVPHHIADHGGVLPGHGAARPDPEREAYDLYAAEARACGYEVASFSDWRGDTNPRERAEARLAAEQED